MPDAKQTNQPKKSVAPSPGFFERIFGTEEFSPAVQEGIRIARTEMPNMAPVQPYGFFSRLVSPNLLAYTSGGKNIYLNNRANEGQTPQDIADTLTHEQTHVNQASGKGVFATLVDNLLGNSSLPYHQRPAEIEAYQAEKERRARMGRPQSPVPGFMSGQFYTPQDVRLPVRKK